MTHPKNDRNESQDARRHDQHNAVHPDEKRGKHDEKAKQDQNKHPKK